MKTAAFTHTPLFQDETSGIRNADSTRANLAKMYRRDVILDRVIWFCLGATGAVLIWAAYQIF